jgi:hypothetical protein
LFDEGHSSAIKELDIHTTDLARTEDQLRESIGENRAAQWLLVLVRLREIIRSGQKETRKAAFQIVCGICKNHGAQLTAGSWDVLLHTVLFGIVSDNAAATSGETDPAVQASEVQTAYEMTEIILQGTAAVLAQHSQIIESISALPRLWDLFVDALETLLSHSDYSTYAAIYRSLTSILATIETPSHAWRQPVERSFALWSKQVPQSSRQTSSEKDNQVAFVAYAELATELYRLTSAELTTERVFVIVERLFACVRQSEASYYGADVHSTSPLQGKVLDLLKSLRTDVPGAKSRLVSTAAAAIVLHTETADQAAAKTSRPSFIALSGDSIEWLQDLILVHAGDAELYADNAVVEAIQSLRTVISRKYATRQDYKGTMLWRRATSAAIAVAQAVLTKTQSPETSKETSTALWSEFVHISAAIVNANDLHLFADAQRVYDDQLSDIDAYKSLRQIMIPRLGGDDLPDSCRRVFAESLFLASIIHQVETNELPTPDSTPTFLSSPALQNITSTRRGRVSVPFSRREQMSYVCFNELIALSSAKPTPTPEDERLARVAAPLLVLRLAIPVRAYIADQPLRGRAPQPLSELEELLFCFENIENLEVCPGALPDRGQVGGGKKAHLAYLYPLLAKAVKTAGDRWSGSEEVLDPLQETLERLAVF